MACLVLPRMWERTGVPAAAVRWTSGADGLWYFEGRPGLCESHWSVGPHFFLFGALSAVLIVHLSPLYSYLHSFVFIPLVSPWPSSMCIPNTCVITHTSHPCRSSCRYYIIAFRISPTISIHLYLSYLTHSNSVGRCQLRYAFVH